MTEGDKGSYGLSEEEWDGLVEGFGQEESVRKVVENLSLSRLLRAVLQRRSRRPNNFVTVPPDKIGESTKVVFVSEKETELLLRAAKKEEVNKETSKRGISRSYRR